MGRLGKDLWLFFLFTVAVSVVVVFSMPLVRQAVIHGLEAVGASGAARYADSA